MTFAALADVHGNSWALTAVLADITEQEDIAEIVHLGDAVWGVLDPAGTVDLLRSAGVTSIAGNQDREVLDPQLSTDSSLSLRFTREHLTADQIEWLRAMSPVAVRDEGWLLCHGTPVSDTTYLLECVREQDCVEERRDEEVTRLLGNDVPQRLILCGHTHLARVRHLPGGRLVVNPGSVGLQAYSDDLPYWHAMESGSPHARYAVLRRHHGAQGWDVTLREVVYDWEAAAQAAERHGRRDWAYQLRYGRVERA